MVEQLQEIQRRDPVEDPLLIEHEQRKDQDAGHSGYVKEAALMNAEEKELREQQAGAQVLIEGVGADPGDVQNPHADAARRHEKDHPELPRQNNRDHAQHGAEARGDDGQQQVPAGLLLCPHCVSNSWEIRRISSWGRKGFFR